MAVTVEEIDFVSYDFGARCFSKSLALGIFNQEALDHVRGMAVIAL